MLGNSTLKSPGKIKIEITGLEKILYDLKLLAELFFFFSKILIWKTFWATICKSNENLIFPTAAELWITQYPESNNCVIKH